MPWVPAGGLGVSLGGPGPWKDFSLPQPARAQGRFGPSSQNSHNGNLSAQLVTIINAQKIYFQQLCACNYMFLVPISPPEPDANLARGFCLIYLSVPSPSLALTRRTPGTSGQQLGG